MLEQGQQNVPSKFLLQKPSYECAYQAVILSETLHYHTPSRGNGGAAYAANEEPW